MVVQSRKIKKYESNDFYVRLFCFLVDVVGSIIFFPLKKIQSKIEPYNPRKIKRIVIFRLDGLGDVILSTAALREIRNGFPDARITLVVSPWAMQLIKHSKSFDRLIVYDSFLFGIFRGKRKFNLQGELKVIRELRQMNFDLGIDLRGDLLSIIPMFLARCRYRFATASRGGGFLLTHIVPYDYAAMPSQQQKNLQVVNSLGIPVKDVKLEVEIDKASESKVNNFLEERQLAGKKIVLMIPCALYKWKSWPADKFAQLASEIMLHYDVKIVLVGTSEQKPVLSNINQITNMRLINLAGELSVLEVAALLKKSKLCITNDSGIMHLAAAFEIPLIQLFGPGPPEPFGHYYPRSRIIQKTDCQYYPCTQRICKNEENWCMNKITVSDVLYKIKDLGGI